MGTRRCHHDVIADVLTCCLEGAGKSRIQRRVSFHWTRLQHYLNLLTTTDLLEQVDHTYHITIRGHHYLGLYRSLTRYLE